MGMIIREHLNTSSCLSLSVCTAGQCHEGVRAKDCVQDHIVCHRHLHIQPVNIAQSPRLPWQLQIDQKSQPSCQGDPWHSHAGDNSFTMNSQKGMKACESVRMYASVFLPNWELFLLACCLRVMITVDPSIVFMHAVYKYVCVCAQ